MDYTYGHVVSTLAAIEDTHPDVYVRIDNDDDLNKPLDAADSEAAGAVENQPKPITSKLRTTIKHLRARAGPWSRFRGLSMYLVYHAVRSLMVRLFLFGSQHYFLRLFVHLGVDILLANLQVAWVHIVISEPSPKRFYQRIPGPKEWRKFVPVVALQALAIRAAFYVPMAVIQLFGGVDTSEASVSNMCKLSAILAGPALLAILVAVPVHAVFVRVAASTLPEECETIVPFDRSFGGKVVPAILGGSGAVSIADAWKTFDWPARKRYFKVIAKVFAIKTALVVALGGAFAGLAFAAGTDAIRSLEPGSA